MATMNAIISGLATEYDLDTFYLGANPSTTALSANQLKPLDIP